MNPEDLIKGGKFVGFQLLDTAIKGWEGKMQDVVANFGLSSIESVIKKIIPDFNMEVEDFTVFGSIKYWDKILGNIKDANQKLGIAGNLGVNLQSSFREAYPLVVDMGISAEEMGKSVESFFNKTGRAQILSSNQMAEMSKMTKVLGEESMDIVVAYGNVGLSIQNSTKRMRNLIKESDKFGVLPTKVSGILKANIENINKYSFKNGVKALEQMAIYAAKTNTDLKSAFGVADKILQGGIEGTMEMSTELQLLGGSFGNMSNMSEMIYLARNEPEKFAEMFNKAAADMADFNEETGEIKYSAYSMDIFRKVAQATGYEMDDLVKGGQSLKKSMMIGDVMDSSLKGLKNYDELLTKVSGAAFKNDSGDWVVKMKKDGKEIEQAVSALTEDQIKQISFTDETKGPEAAFENIAKSNEKLGETMNRLIETLKTQALSSAPYEQFSQVARVAADNIKELAAPFVKSFSELNEKAMENVLSVIKPLSEGNVGGAMDAAKENLTGAANKAYEVGSYALGQMGTILYNVFTNAAKFLAAGIEWGFRNSLGALQRAFIWAYDNTFGHIFGYSKSEVKDSYVEFKDVIGKYNIKGALEDTTLREDFYKMLNYNSTQSNTTTNAPVENKPVPEVKKEAEVEKKLTSSNKEVNEMKVTFTNPMEMKVNGLTYNADGKLRDAIIEKGVSIIKNEDATTTSKPIEFQNLGTNK